MLAGGLAELIDRPFNINSLANKVIGGEMSERREESLALQCARLPIPALVVHGADDLRPAWAVDSLVDALPNVDAFVLEHAGHSPWLEVGDHFYDSLRMFLRATLDLG